LSWHAATFRLDHTRDDIVQALTQNTSCEEATANFAQVPFKALDTCHEDIAAMLDEMSALADQLDGEPQSDILEAKARDAHLFFASHAIEHHLDEERHVFPALLESGRPDWIAVVRKLQQDHALIEARWVDLGPQLHLFARGYRVPCERLQAHLRAFIALYRAHMTMEDAQVYPCARRLLAVEDVCAMNSEMAHRRVKAPVDDVDDGWV